MFSQEKRVALFEQIQDSVVKYDEETTVKLCHVALDDGIDAYDIIMEGLAKGMETVGELYEKKEYYVPELLLCSDALYAALDVLRPHVKKDSQKVSGKILMGVVEGDIHDIGKTLVKTMFEAAGWKIYDLGKDVGSDKFAEQLEKTDADVVALSALMTTSMLAMPKVIEMLKAQKPKVIVMVGGAPLNAEIARRYGADGYADNAVSAVHEAERLVAATAVC